MMEVQFMGRSLESEWMPSLVNSLHHGKDTKIKTSGVSYQSLKA